MVDRHPVKRFDVHLISLDPTKGSEIRKTRPCLIISPDEMNKHIRTVIIAPMTSTIKNYPTRVTTTFQGRKGQIVLDQIRTVDKSCLIKNFGSISKAAEKALEEWAEKNRDENVDLSGGLGDFLRETSIETDKTALDQQNEMGDAYEDEVLD